VAVAYLGTGELQDLALVLFVGMLSGTYSSIFIATPVLASLKERHPQYKQLARRVALRESGGRAAQRARAKAEKAGRVPGAGRGADADSGAAGAGPADDAPLTDAELAAELVEAEDAQYDDVTDDANDDSADAGTDDRIPAGRTASGSTAPRTPAPGARTGPRQQPRRNSAAKRRPAGKKKRR
jgi:preprotein translocase subunit SecF